MSGILICLPVLYKGSAVVVPIEPVCDAVVLKVSVSGVVVFKGSVSGVVFKWSYSGVVGVEGSVSGIVVFKGSVSGVVEFKLSVSGVAVPIEPSSNDVVPVGTLEVCSSDVPPACVGALIR